MLSQISLKFIHAINTFGYAIPYFKVIKKNTPNMDSETQTHLNCMLMVCCLFCLLHKGVHIASHKSQKQKKPQSAYVLIWRPYNGFVIKNKRL